MKKRRKMNKVILISFFGIALLALGTAYSILRQDIKIIGKATLVEQNENTADYTVTYEIINKWYNEGKYYYNILISLQNNTLETLDGWKVEMKAPENAELLACYDANCTLNGNRLEFTNLSYNAQVPSKGKVTFQFQIATTDAYYKPGDIIVNGTTPIVPPDQPEQPEEKKAEVIVQMENSWQSDSSYFYQLKATVRNIGNVEINSWKFDIDFQSEANVEQIWNASAEKKTESRYSFLPSTYNAVIPKGGEASFAFIVKLPNERSNFEAIEIILN